MQYVLNNDSNILIQTINTNQHSKKQQSYYNILSHKNNNMRIIRLQEHVTFPELTAQIPEAEMQAYSLGQSPFIKKLAPVLADVNGDRLASMDKNGISLQVLSVVGAGADLLNETSGPTFAKKI